MSITRRIATAATILGLLACHCARSEAALLTTFQDALQPGVPASGWSYLYNNGGPIGDPSNYTPLLATSDPDYFYDDDGVVGLPGPAPGSFVYFGLIPAGLGLLDEGQAGGHPGRGFGDSGSGGIERFAIAAYTLSVGGLISITDGLLTSVNNTTDGLDLLVFVNGNSTPSFSGSTVGGRGSFLAFDASLGVLDAGDTIYVAVGGRLNDASDSFSFRYGITAVAVAVPEPSSLALSGVAGMAGLGIARARRRAA